MGLRRALVRGLGYGAGVRWALPARTGAVALTFDDGPDPQSSPAVLDILAAAGVRATFFCVGQHATRHPHLVRRMVDEGHAVGSHSWSHPVPWTIDRRTLHDDYDRGHDAVVTAMGRRTRLFRPPKGYLGRDGVLTALRLGLRPVLWTRHGEDWTSGATPGGILEMIGAVERGDVVLLHDAIAGLATAQERDRTATIAALPQLIDRIRSAGLRLVTLDDAR